MEEEKKKKKKKGEELKAVAPLPRSGEWFTTRRDISERDIVRVVRAFIPLPVKPFYAKSRDRDKIAIINRTCVKQTHLDRRAVRSVSFELLNPLETITNLKIDRAN